MSGQARDFRETIRTNLRAEMDRTGVTLSALARAIGTAERQITRWRGGKHTPEHGSVVRLAAYFGRSTEWFYTDHSDESVAA